MYLVYGRTFFRTSRSFTKQVYRIHTGISEGKMFVLLDRITLEELPLEEVRRKCSTHVYVVFADPSGDANFPGWPLRGLILTIAYHMPEIANSEHTGVYTVISLRGSRIHNYNKSRIFRVRLQKVISIYRYV